MTRPTNHLLPQGFQYCDLLLGQGKCGEALERTRQTLEWAIPQRVLLAIAMDRLSLGRTHLLQALRQGSQELDEVAQHLNQAVNGLRQAGQQDYLPRGLIARAESHRLQEQFGRAQRDLEEVMTIASRGGMELHKADCHLEYARLYAATGHAEQVKKHLVTAKGMVEKMGLHRWDWDADELGKTLDGE